MIRSAPQKLRKMFEFFRFLKRRPGQVTADLKPKKAVAIIAYNNLGYFKAVLESVVAQTIDGKPFSDHYDLFIFQDALQARHQTSLADYEAIKNLSLQHVSEDRFTRQPSNIGIGLHFALVESTLFEDKGYDFAVLLEHDYVLGAGYLQVMEQLRVRFENDHRVACVSVQSQAFREDLAKQEDNKSQYLCMAHDWGGGVFKRTWLNRKAAMESYYQLLTGVPFEQRNNLLIHRWMGHMGFVLGSTSQDTIKACVDTALHTVRITPYVNMGKYIGAQGMHWTDAHYKAAGYDRTVIWSGQYQAPDFTDEDFSRIFSQQSGSYLASPKEFDFEGFRQKVSIGGSAISFSPNEVTVSATHDDVVAAYKLFLRRFPESQEVVDARRGQSMDLLFKAFLLSDEFLQNKANWSTVVDAAKKIIELNAASQKAPATEQPQQQSI